MKKTLEAIEHLRRAKSCILPSDYGEDDVRRKDEWHQGYDEALRHIEEELSLGYMVLGFRDFACNPNDFGMVDERDNPLILDYHTAKELGDKVTLAGLEEYGMDFRAKIVILAHPEEVYFKG